MKDFVRESKVELVDTCKCGYWKFENKDRFCPGCGMSMECLVEVRLCPFCNIDMREHRYDTLFPNANYIINARAFRYKEFAILTDGDRDTWRADYDEDCDAVSITLYPVPKKNALDAMLAYAAKLDAVASAAYACIDEYKNITGG